MSNPPPSDHHHQRHLSKGVGDDSNKQHLEKTVQLAPEVEVIGSDSNASTSIPGHQPKSSTSSSTSTSAPLSKSGWDGKLRVSHVNDQPREGADTDDEEEDDEEDDEQEEEEDNEAPTKSSDNHAVLAQGEVIEGYQIEADEDLCADLDDDVDDIDLAHCRIRDSARLRLDRFKAVRRLCLRQNAISDPMLPLLLPPNLAPTLEELDLYDNLIAHIRGLDGFVHLKSLDLSFNKIKHVKRIHHLTKLKDLYLVQNRVTAIDGVDALTELRNLELGGNRIRVIENLETLTSLEELWLGKNKITEITGLSSLVNLKILSIQSNRLRSITGLESLKSLEGLHISHNALTSLSGLASNTNLRVIDISWNPISELTGLETLVLLEELWASYCKFDSFQDVETQLRNKEKLETVYFEGNPLQLRQPALYRNKVKLALPQIKQIDATFVRV